MDWKKNNTLENAVNTGKSGLGVINSLFAPITAGLKGAEKIPGVGVLAVGVNALFGAIGSGSAEIGDNLLNDLPISDKAKETVRPLVQETASLAGMILAGRAGVLDFGKFADKSKAIVDNIRGNVKVEALDLPVKSESIETQVPISTPTKRLAEFSKKEGYEPITPDAQLPEIEFGKKGKGEKTVPTIQIGEKTQTNNTAKNDGLTYEPVVSEVPVEVKQPVVTERPTEIIPIAEKTVPTEVPIGTKSSGIAKSIEQKAIEANMTKGYSEVAGYDPITIKDQSTRATDLINNDFETARAVIKGEKPLPEGLRGTALITAMEEHIKKTKNADLAYELANSNLVSETSFAAQELRLAAERNPDSLTAKFKEIKDAREKQFERRNKKTSTKAKQEAVKEIKDSIKKSVSKRPTWEEFINSVTCK